MSDKYLVIAYKSSGESYCRGCLMSSYASELEQMVCDGLDEVVDWVAAVKTCVVNGDEDGFDEITIYDSNLEEVSDDAPVWTPIHRKVAIIRKKRDEEARETRNAARLLEKEMTKKRDLAELARLKDEYPNV